MKITAHSNVMKRNPKMIYSTPLEIDVRSLVESVIKDADVAKEIARLALLDKWHTPIKHQKNLNDLLDVFGVLPLDVITNAKSRGVQRLLSSQVYLDGEVNYGNLTKDPRMIKVKLKWR